MSSYLLSSVQLDVTNIVLIVVWAIILIGCIVAEIVASNFITMWFALGALIALILLACGVTWYIQLPVFVVVSIISVGVFYPLLRKRVQKLKTLRTNVAGLINQVAQVTELDTGHPGVKDGVAWLAGMPWVFVNENQHQPLQVGDRVRVNKISGTRLYVVKIKQQEER